jgi:hypothetical protein
MKALASSFGIRRTVASASITPSTSSIASSLFPPSTLGLNNTMSTARTTPEREADSDVDPAADDDDDDTQSRPLPGTAQRPGAPAPADATRLSLGAGAGATTIRLISPPPAPVGASLYASPPKLRPFATAFDLDMGTPGRARIYPALPPASSAAPAAVPTPAPEDSDAEMPGAFSVTASPAQPVSPTPAAGAAALSPRPEPFVFGSRHPRYSLSDAGFASAADGVLAEANRRLLAAGAAPVAVPLPDLLARGRAAREAGGGAGTEVEPAGPEPAPRFDEAHASEFARMESIADVVRRREAAGVVGSAPSLAGRKRKSSVVQSARAAAAPAAARKPIPGALVGDDSDDGADGSVRRLSKRPRVAELDPAELAQREEAKRKEDERASREREAIRRKLEASRARRRSSRMSGVGARPRVSVAKTPSSEPLESVRDVVH